MIYRNFATYFEKYVSQKKTFQTKVTHFFTGIEVEKNVGSHLKKWSSPLNDLEVVHET